MTFREAEPISNNSRQLGKVKTISDIWDEFNPFQNTRGFMVKLNPTNEFQTFWGRLTHFKHFRFGESLTQFRLYREV